MWGKIGKAVVSAGKWAWKNKGTIISVASTIASLVK